MSEVTIKLKNGNTRKFPRQGRSGGSWSNNVRYEGAFVIVRDEYGKETAFPALDVEEVTYESESRGSW